MLYTIHSEIKTNIVRKGIRHNNRYEEQWFVVIIGSSIRLGTIYMYEYQHKLKHINNNIRYII